MPSTIQVYRFLKKRYPNDGRKFHLMSMSKLYAIYYSVKRKENTKKQEAKR